jgi:predicted Zn-ribbon and HTH transcriptional regulator
MGVTPIFYCFFRILILMLWLGLLELRLQPSVFLVALNQLTWRTTLLCKTAYKKVGAQMKSLEKVILDILETKQPRNVKELVQLVQEQVGATLDDIEKEVKRLHRKGLVLLEEPTRLKENFSSFLSPRKSRWFWIVIGLSLFSFVSILFFPETGTPLSYLRYIFGFVLVAFLPGYCLNEALFPREDAMDVIERFTFSIGLSFAVTALVGLFLSFTPFGLTLTTALPALGSLVIVLAIVALIRKYKTQ